MKQRGRIEQLERELAELKARVIALERSDNVTWTPYVVPHTTAGTDFAFWQGDDYQCCWGIRAPQLSVNL